MRRAPAYARSTSRRRPWDPSDLLGPAGECIERPPQDALARLRPLLVNDMETEFDGQFLMRHVEALPFELSEPARLAFEEWNADEAQHYAGFRTALEVLFDDAERDFEALQRRAPDFGPLASVFEDEFRLLLLGAYDELCTVRGYRGNLDLYDRLGVPFGDFVRRVIADEARHYSLFLGVLRERYAARRAEAPAIIAEIRALEGTPYAQTFVLDHDDAELYTGAVCDQAARILHRQFVER